MNRLTRLVSQHPAVSLLAGAVFVGGIIAGVVTSGGGSPEHMTSDQATASIVKFTQDTRATDCDQLQRDVMDASRHRLKWDGGQFVNDKAVANHWEAAITLLGRAAEECQSGDQDSYRLLLKAAGQEFQSMTEAADPN
jgi:hypothetical protein